MDLLPHNLKAYRSVKKHLRKSKRTCVIHPTGTGKSMIALQLIEDKPNDRILYITSVAANLLEFWDKVEELGNRRMVLSLSQSSIPKAASGEFKGDLDGADAIPGPGPSGPGDECTPPELLDEDKETKSISYEDRQRMLKKATEFDDSYLEGPVIQFCLYAGLENLLPDFDLIIVDEFHRAGAPQWEARIKRLLDENGAAKVVGFSATPERMDGRDMRSLFYNDVASEMKLSSTIASGLLPLPHYWLGKIEVDELDESQEFKKGNKKKKLRKRGYPGLAKRHFEAGAGLKEVFRESLIPEKAVHGKFIVFCRTVNNARSLKKASEEWFDWVDEVHRYEMHTKDRDGFSDFVNDGSDSLRLLFVVDMLTEGVHMEDLDGVIMIRPTESERVYYQQLGRALAVTTKRENPVVIDLVSNAGVMKSGMDFWREVGDEMRDFTEVDPLNKFFHITAEAADFISYVEETEYDYYAAMKEFYEEHGHLYIPPGYKADGHDVYKEHARIRSCGAMLSSEFRKKYDDIGMDWEITYQWMKGFWAAEEYFNEHGNIDVPSTYMRGEDKGAAEGTGNNATDDGVWLYDFLKRNRLKQDHLYERQRMMLDSLGMDWTVPDPWEEKYQELAEYRNAHGHCDVPGDYGALGRWVSDLRKRPPKDGRRKRLDDLGFEWDGRQSRSRNAWRAGLEHSIGYYKMHGDLKVPGGYVCADGYRLGNFVKRAKADGRFEELEKDVTIRLL